MGVVKESFYQVGELLLEGSVRSCGFIEREREEGWGEWKGWV